MEREQLPEVFEWVVQTIGFTPDPDNLSIVADQLIPLFLLGSEEDVKFALGILENNYNI